MGLVKQVIKGRQVSSFNITANSGDITPLLGILEGAVTYYVEKSNGGTAVAYPATLNRKKFSCGHRAQKISTSFTVPHVKATAFTPDFESVVVGAFTANPESSVKCDYMNLLYDRN